MAINDLFKKVPVEVPNRSGFDLSHENLFSATVGTLVPCLVHELLPNDSVSLGVSSQIQLPPMATDFYGRVKAHFEAFFVPNRLLFGGWQDFITHNDSNYTLPSGSTPGQQSRELVGLQIPSSAMGAGSLSDYLGVKPVTQTSSAQYAQATLVENPLRFVAYHKVWDDWFRDSRLQVSAFEKAVFGSTANTVTFSHLPWLTTPYQNAYIQSSDMACADGVLGYSLRQRNFARDYFTNATALPQAGTGASLSFGVNNNTGTFSIAALRAANSLQKWLEVNNISGYRYGDQIKAQFGIYPADAIMDRALYLGRSIVPVYNKSVYLTSKPTSTSTSGYVNNLNPFNVQGAKYASTQGVGDGSIFEKFTAQEHGILMVLFSLVPDAVYDAGSHRSFGYKKSGDFPFPLLSGVGDQPIYQDEIFTPTLSVSGQPTAIDPTRGSFGYTQRYSEAKYMLDEVHGLLRDGQSLSPFALKRGFSSSPSLGSSFLEIPTNYLDQVTALSSYGSSFGCWVDAFFSMKKSSTLPAYSIPTLGDMKNTHTEVIPNGGTRL